MIRAVEDDDGRIHMLHSENSRIGLWLPAEGDGSHAELVEYVRTVLEQNCDLKPGYNPTGSFDKLARGTVFSILHRLGIQWEELNQ